MTNEDYECDIDLVDQELAKKLINSKCNARKHLGDHLCDLLMQAPLNKTLRAKVMAVVGQMPAADLDTFEKIEEWVESTYEPKSNPCPPVPAVRPSIIVNLKFKDEVRGNCTYLATRSSVARWTINETDINEIIETAPSMDDAIQLIYDFIQENAWNEIQPEMDDEEYSYDNYEDEEYSNKRVSNRESVLEIQQQLSAYISRTQPPEVRNKFGL